MGSRIASITKNDWEKIVFTLNEFKGKNYLDIRVFSKDRDGEDVPTKKGIALSVDLYPQFKQLLAKAEAAMFAAKWIDPEDLPVGE
jgi:hypothetical protein